MWHLASYAVNQGAVTDGDMTAPADGVFGIRNNHLLFTEPYAVAAAWASGLTLTRMRFGNAALTQKGSNHLWPLDTVAQPGNLPLPMDRRSSPINLPVNEEITLLATNSGAGPQDDFAHLWLVSPGWTPDWPLHDDRLQPRATATIVAGAARTWGAEASIVQERDLLNGVYAVVGCQVFYATGTAFRLRFPDQRATNGKQLRPGNLVQTAVGNKPWDGTFGGFGEWGRFHTFSPPVISIFADATGGTAEIRLDCLFLGADRSLLESGTPMY